MHLQTISPDGLVCNTNMISTALSSRLLLHRLTREATESNLPERLNSIDACNMEGKLGFSAIRVSGTVE